MLLLLLSYLGFGLHQHYWLFFFSEIVQLTAVTTILFVVVVDKILDLAMS